MEENLPVLYPKRFIPNAFDESIPVKLLLFITTNYIHTSNYIKTQLIYLRQATTLFTSSPI